MVRNLLFAYFISIVFCFAVDKSIPSTTLGEMNELRERIAKIQSELQKDQGRLESSHNGLRNIPAETQAMSAKEFSEVLQVPEEQIDINNPLFEYEPIFEKVKIIGPTLLEPVSDRFAKFWYSIRVEYFTKKTNLTTQELEQRRKILSTIEKDRPRVIEKEAIEKMQKKDLITEIPTKILSMDPKSNFSEQIIFMEGGKCPLVGKVFKTIENYKSEKGELKSLGQYTQMVNEFRERCQMQLPLIVEYKGAFKIGGKKTGIILLDKAKGKSIAEIQEHLYEMSQDRIIKIFSAIGHQLGLLDVLFYKNRNGQQLRHIDLHQENITFDESDKVDEKDKGGQVYLLDNAGMALKPWQNTITGNSFSNNYLPKGSVYYIKRREMGDNEEKIKDLAIHYKKLFTNQMLAYYTLYKAYVDEMKAVEVDLYENYSKSTPIVSALFDLDQFNGELRKYGIEPIDIDRYRKLS